MSRRRVQIVLVCEDTQHEAFVRRFLYRCGWQARQIRVEKAPAGRGSGEQFVRERFPIELAAVRSGHVDRAVIVTIDGDKIGPAGRPPTFPPSTNRRHGPADTGTLYGHRRG